MAAAAGGRITRRLRSTASSRGSRIQFTSIGSRREAGSSWGGTWLEGRASTDSDMRPLSFSTYANPTDRQGPNRRRKESSLATLRRPTYCHKVAQHEGSTTMVFRIQPHTRLHEWVADELGFFRDEGLVYEFDPDRFAAASAMTGTVSPAGEVPGQISSGAFEDMAKGRSSDVPVPATGQSTPRRPHSM